MTSSASLTSLAMGSLDVASAYASLARVEESKRAMVVVVSSSKGENGVYRYTNYQHVMTPLESNINGLYSISRPSTALHAFRSYLLRALPLGPGRRAAMVVEGATQYVWPTCSIWTRQE